MILRSLTRHVRAQNWFAVGLDFLIVVVGIFVGLQVTEWNERRQVIAREGEYLVRLREDLGVMRDELDVLMERADGRSARALDVFRALERCDRELASDEDFDLTFAGYQNQRTIAIVDRTYDEMVASGALAAMADRELSGRIAGLFSALQNYKEGVRGVRVSLPVVDRILWSSVDLSYDEAGRPELAGFDFEQACRDRELRNAVWEIHDLFSDYENFSAMASEQLDTSIDALARDLRLGAGS
ncbi:MAG: hypothetical protein R3323_02110 [Wenzhouxiangellaceae bacterium]|nr:hypothetical protein [Wenzhouxiangellaceae bacterium]